MRTFFDLLRRELDVEGLISISVSEWEDMIREYREFAINCSESTNRDVCDKRLRDYKATFKDLIKLRILKVLETEEVPEEAADSAMLKLVLELVRSFTSSLDEVVSDEKGKVFVIIKKKIEVDGVVVEPQELVMMNLMEAVALSAFGYVEMLTLPVEASERYSWITSEKVKPSPI